jgi:hypothetical protein
MAHIPLSQQVGARIPAAKVYEKSPDDVKNTADMFKTGKVRLLTFTCPFPSTFCSGCPGPTPLCALAVTYPPL